jgi:hypothetical protein
VEALKKLLSARTANDFDENRAGAEAELAGIFSTSEWGMEFRCQAYTRQNYENLWTNELRTAIRELLKAAGKTSKDYAEWLGEVQYINVAIYPRRLFKDHEWDTGWRLAFLAVPPVRATAMGIASFYKDSTSQNALGRASGLLMDLASKGLGDGVIPGSKVSADFWDKRALIPAPVLNVCGVDISPVAPQGLELADVRVSTVKKNIASFISITPVVIQS